MKTCAWFASVLQEFDETDDQLQQQYRTFEQTVVKIRNDKAEEEAKLSQKRKQEKHYNKEYQVLVTGIGKIEAEEQDHISKKSELVSKIAHLAET